MNFLSQLSQPPGLILVAFINLLAGIVLWGVVIERWFSGDSMLKHQPRRRVPWQIWDLAAIILFFSATLSFFILLFKNVKLIPNPDPNAVAKAAKISSEHLLVQLVESKNWVTLAAAVIVGVIIVPIAEEMFYRVFLQGWLENVERKLRHRFPGLIRMLPLATMSIFFSSLIFGAAHYREAGPSPDARTIMWSFIGLGLANLLTLLFAVLWVSSRVGATAADLGWQPEKLPSDARLGIISFISIAIPLFSVQLNLRLLLPDKYVPDPITIFIFAIPLGLLYNRTHRAAPSIAMHMALNATSLTLAFLG